MSLLHSTIVLHDIHPQPLDFGCIYQQIPCGRGITIKYCDRYHCNICVLMSEFNLKINMLLRVIVIIKTHGSESRGQ